MKRCWRLGLSLAFLTSLSQGQVLYKARGVVVSASELVNAIEFCVHAPESIFASIWVDRNHNGRVDSRVDTLYSLNPDRQHICTAYLLGVEATTVCSVGVLCRRHS